MPEIEALSSEVRSSLTFVELTTGIVFFIEFLLHTVSKPIGASAHLHFHLFSCISGSFLWASCVLR